MVLCMGLMPLPQPQWTSSSLNPHSSSHSAPLLWLFPLQKCPLLRSAMPATAKSHTNLQVQPLCHILWNVSWLPQAELMFLLLYFPIRLFTALIQPSTIPHSISCGPLCVRSHILSIVLFPQRSVLPGTAAMERMLADVISWITQ